MKLLRTIKRLKNPRDLRLFLNILAMLILLPRLIRRKSLPELLKNLDPGVGPRRGDHELLVKTAGFTDSLLRYHVFQRYGKCLLRSLLLFRFLRRQGWPVEIHFGVRKIGEAGIDSINDTKYDVSSHMGITGHSWLVLAGEPFLEEESRRGSFATTYTYAG
ncbi:MAG: lasso peptide biosynthesis B2 protein [Actinomycetota bacterium]